MDTKEKAYEAYWYLNDNFSWAIINLDMTIVKVNPDTGRIEDNIESNTKVEYWLEGGKAGEHDIRLDCGAPTFDEALIKFTLLVKKYYEKDEEKNISL